MSFGEAVQGLLAGDFSRLEHLCLSQADGSPSQILLWYEEGRFDGEPEALAEAFTCATFNGCVHTMERLLAGGTDPSGGIRTGLNAVHWAANRGHVTAVDLLIGHVAPLETKNMYGGTVLGGTVWSAVHEPGRDRTSVVEALLRAGADVRGAEYPCGIESIDALLRSYGADDNE